MKILYGVQTTGNGHINRSRLVINALRAEGHDVSTLFSGSGRSAFWNYDDFLPFFESRGLSFTSQNGQVCYLKSTANAKPIELAKDIKNLDLSGFDVVISDFEPITAWAAKQQNKTSIGISNQVAFHYDIPCKQSNVLTRFILKHYAPTQHRLGLHWHHFGQPLLPPIIDPALTITTSADGFVYLVYLPFENREQVIKQFQAFPNHSFIYYTNVETMVQHGNVCLHPFNRQRFSEDLCRCDGVICQAGFELPSEALHLGKKLLVKPVHRQNEQISNAKVLSQYNLGFSTDTLDLNSIASFLVAQKAKPKNYPNVAKAIAQWISQADLNSPSAHLKLVEQLWNRETLAWSAA